MLEDIKKRVLQANLLLAKYSLAVLTWGNASAIDRKLGLAVIKPSGVAYADMKAEDMVVVDLDGNVVEGKFKPSSDTPTHLHLYKAFKDIGGVVHTHSLFATARAQSGKSIPPYGTTHADLYYGEIPCTRALSENEVKNDYELNTGKVIVEAFKNTDYNAVPAVLVKNHGPFTWGASPEKAVESAVTLEQVAKAAYITETTDPAAKPVPRYLLDKHYFRKHGKNSYYGQGEK